MTFTPLDPRKFVVNVGGAPITGWGEGKSLTIDFANNHVEVEMGNGGDYRFIIDPRGNGVITCRLMASSPSNLAMTAAYLAEQPVPFIYTDPRSNGTLFTSDAVMVQKMSMIEVGDGETNTAWPLVFGRGKMNQAGARLFLPS